MDETVQVSNTMHRVDPVRQLAEAVSKHRDMREWKRPQLEDSEASKEKRGTGKGTLQPVGKLSFLQPLAKYSARGMYVSR